MRRTKTQTIGEVLEECGPSDDHVNESPEHPDPKIQTMLDAFTLLVTKPGDPVRRASQRRLERKAAEHAFKHINRGG